MKISMMNRLRSVNPRNVSPFLAGATIAAMAAAFGSRDDEPLEQNRQFTTESASSRPNMFSNFAKAVGPNVLSSFSSHSDAYDLSYRPRDQEVQRTDIHATSSIHAAHVSCPVKNDHPTYKLEQVTQVVHAAIESIYVLFAPKTSKTEAASRRDMCQEYGCPLTRQDILYAPVQSALLAIRNQSKSSHLSRDIKLKPSGDELKATLTLVGYKGGDAKDQINQDRAFVISPYLSGEISEDDLKANRLMGVFDGHALYGEKVAEYCMNEVPKKLADKLSKRLSPNTSSEQHDSVVKQALEEVFCELDRDCPDGEHGGCTASVILQLGHKLFVANTGDSRSFICVHRTKAGSTEIVYTTRDHKPGVPEERARVESMGGKVWIANGPGCAARVLFTDPLTGLQTGLAMSRSIGDRDVGKYGVIPNPTVDVIDLREIIQKRVLDMNLIPSVGFDEHNDPVLQDCIDEDKKVLIDDVHIFAVSASDGMMDVLEPKSIARLLVPSLCHENGEHLLTACEKLVSTAAKGWQQASEDGGYRDDIAISVSKIRTPPCT